VNIWQASAYVVLETRTERKSLPNFYLAAQQELRKVIETMQTPNKTSVFFAVIASGLALFSTMTAAQAGDDATVKGAHKAAPGKRAGAAKIIADLGLNETQKKQALVIEADWKKQGKAIHDNKSLTEDQKKTKMRAVMTASMSKIMAILTPEQKKTLQTKMMAGSGKMTKMQGAKGASAAHKL
jgi:protein CpxP